MNEEERIKGLSNPILLSLVIIGLIEPQAMLHMAGTNHGIWAIIHWGLTVINVLSFVTSIMLAFYMVKRKRDIFVPVLFVLLSLILFCNISNGIYYSALFLYVMNVWTVVFFFRYFLNVGKLYNFVKVFEFWLYFFSVINVLTQIFYPQGLYVDDRGWAMFFYGNPNAFVYQYFMCLLMSCLSNLMSYGKLKFRFYLLIALFVYSEFLGESSTSIFAILVFVVLTVIFRDRVFSRVKAGNLSLSVSAVSSYIIISMGVNSTFANMIEYFFHKKLKHCSSCNICVIGIDHHCGVFGKCIARNNIIFFYSFIVLTFVSIFASMGVLLYSLSQLP